MTGILLTILAAIVLMALVMGLLAIGWLLTGKSRLRRGTCGMVPSEKGKEDKKSVCSICGATKVCEREEEKQK